VVLFSCTVLWIRIPYIMLVDLYWIYYILLIFFGNFSWNAFYLIFFMISKDLYIFWSSFFEDYFDWIFLASNYMLPSCFSSWRFCFFLSKFSMNVFAVFQLLCNFSKKVSSCHGMLESLYFILILIFSYLFSLI